jgi:hypothetical protein
MALARRATRVAEQRGAQGPEVSKGVVGLRLGPKQKKGGSVAFVFGLERLLGPAALTGTGGAEARTRRRAGALTSEMRAWAGGAKGWLRRLRVPRVAAARAELKIKAPKDMA